MLHPPNAPLPILPLPLLPTLHPSCQCSVLTMTIDNKNRSCSPLLMPMLHPSNVTTPPLPILPMMMFSQCYHPCQTLREGSIWVEGALGRVEHGRGVLMLGVVALGGEHLKGTLSRWSIRGVHVVALEGAVLLYPSHCSP